MKRSLLIIFLMISLMFFVGCTQQIPDIDYSDIDIDQKEPSYRNFTFEDINQTLGDMNLLNRYPAVYEQTNLQDRFGENIIRATAYVWYFSDIDSLGALIVEYTDHNSANDGLKKLDETIKNPPPPNTYVPISYETTYVNGEKILYYKYKSGQIYVWSKDRFVFFVSKEFQSDVENREFDSTYLDAVAQEIVGVYK